MSLVGGFHQSGKRSCGEQRSFHGVRPVSGLKHLHDSVYQHAEVVGVLCGHIA